MLTDNKNGTITDSITGLLWQQCVEAEEYTWDQVLSYCENLSLAGHSDWRLPGVRVTIVKNKK